MYLKTIQANTAQKCIFSPSQIKSKPSQNETIQSCYKSSVSQIETQDSDSVTEPDWRNEAEATLFKHLEYLVPPSDVEGKRNLKAAIRLALDEIEGLE
jgi:hypothetical protein